MVYCLPYTCPTSRPLPRLIPSAARCLIGRLAALACAWVLGGCTCAVLAQARIELAESPADTGTLIERLAGSLASGQTRSIRDLATLLDAPRDAAAARALLGQYTFFESELDVATCSRQALLDFYYRHHDSIRYSELLRGYLVRPLERQAPRYRLVALDAYQRSDRSMHLRKYIAYVERAIVERSVPDLQDLAEKIADLQSLEGQAYLLGWMRSPAADVLATDLDAYLHYLDQLLRRPSVEVADALFESVRRGYLRSGSLAYYLSRLCNVPFSANWSAATHRARYGTLVDSLGSLARVREVGYGASVGFTQAHFREAVDYYGRVLARANTPDYVQHNALLDLLATQHPRALFYLSTQVLAARQGRETAFGAAHYLDLLRKQTNLAVSVEDAAGVAIVEVDIAGDRRAWTNLVRYYATHYEDYDYDEHRGGFINRHDLSLETENLERLFRLLNSEREEVALGAYERLTRADPIEVGQLVGKYADLLRATHPKVPSLKEGHLEHTAQLTAYCSRNRVSYLARPELRRALDSLLLPLAPRTRVGLEDRLVRAVALADLTAVEYWAAIHQYDLAAGYSIGRLLDYAYSRHWGAVLASDAELRLFLKKAVLFARMEGIGISDSYLRKFDSLDGASRARIEALTLSESDKHIARSLRRLLAVNARETESAVRDVDEFLETPDSYGVEEIAELPDPTLEQLSELLYRSSEVSSARARHLYRTYLEQRLDLDLVPDLMSLLIRGESPEHVAGLLGEVYHYRWPGTGAAQPEAWLDLWRRRMSEHRSWGAGFYAEHLAAVRTATRLTGPELNAVLTSPDFVPADRALVLASLGKLASPRHLFMLRFEPGLAWDERAALDSLALSYKDLQDLDKLFRDAPAVDLVDYVLARATGFDAEDLGRLVNGLMRKPWTDDLLDDPRFRHAANFGSALREYLDGATSLSEYEEQNTTLNLARLDFIGMSSLERLQASVALDFEAGARLRIQESILARISYEELPDALRLYPRLVAPDGRHPYNFLNQDFGLPIFELAASSTIDTFVARHRRLAPRALYLRYLEEFGLALAGPDGALDYARIYEILSYDIVLPFIGGGGNRRDLYAYGVIRLLELDEGTLLGFHPKLNENQLFYSYTASKRASAWAKHLLETGRVRGGEVAKRPSFNAVGS